MSSLVVVASLLMASIVAAHARAPQAQEAATSRLQVGDTLRIGGTQVSIVFEAVQSDSRCPKDARCIRAGEAVVILQVEETGRESTPVAFHVPPGGGDSRSSHGYRIEIFRLDPEAETEVEIPQSRYVATLRVDRP